MRVMSTVELQRLSRAELMVLMRTIASELPFLAEHSPELRMAHHNLRMIRNALARRDFRPR